MPAHQINLNNSKRLKIILSIFSNNSGVKLEINYRKKKNKYVETTQHAAERKGGVTNKSKSK